MTAVVGIKRYGIAGIKALLASWGEPEYRAKQLINWLYEKRATEYGMMTNLAKSLRDRLTSEEPLVAPKVLSKQVSHDGTRKYLVQLADGRSVETVGIPEKDGERLTVCFSTQVGCGMACAFCATGTRGLTRSLWPGEMVDQLIVVSEDMGKRVTNAVAMGEGEPFANYEHSLEALRIMNSPDALHIGARHLTVSTCGLLHPLARFAREPEQFTLAVSLHSALQPTRDLLMPALSKQTITELRLALIAYASLSGRRPSLEVTLIQDVNDTDLEVKALIAFAQGLLCHVNLIALNSHEHVLGLDAKHVLERGKKRELKPIAEFRPSSPKRCQEIADSLLKAGIACSIRRSRGADIDAACGQLKGL